MATDLASGGLPPIGQPAGSTSRVQLARESLARRSTLFGLAAHRLKCFKKGATALGKSLVQPEGRGTKRGR